MKNHRHEIVCSERIVNIAGGQRLRTTAELGIWRKVQKVEDEVKEFD